MLSQYDEEKGSTSTVKDLQPGQDYLPSFQWKPVKTHYLNPKQGDQDMAE